ncbi:MAG: hypothetical protein J6Q10_03825, partial [Clostridia bacterium]|nr:hypothetical protein [Clostridia bacterium]
MKKMKMVRSILACVLTFVMLFGTMTSYAAIFTDAEIEAVRGIIDSVKDEIGAKIDAVVDAVKDEIAEIAGIVENIDINDAKDKAEEYVEEVKGNLDAETSAKIDEAIDFAEGEIADIVEAQDKEAAAKAKIDAYIAVIKSVLGITAEDEAKLAEIVADLDDIAEQVKDFSFEDAKAIVDDYVAGLKAKVAKEYAKLGHKHYENADNGFYVAVNANVDGIGRNDASYFELVADVYDAYTDADMPAIEDANLISYQVDAADVLFGALEADADWSKYFAADQVAVIEAAWDKAAEKDATIIGFAEKLAFAVVSYAVDTVKEIKDIQAANPDATLVVLGMYNNFDGVEITVDGNTINVGEYFDYVVEATNIYYTALAAANGGFAFVNIEDAAVDGAAIEVTDDVAALAAAVSRIKSNITANAAGHAYIAEQIVNALTCDGDPCSICGYATPVEPEEDDEPKRTGGSSSSSGQFVVKFDTNGGSAVASVVVKKDALLAEPAAPTKEG